MPRICFSPRLVLLLGVTIGAAACDLPKATYTSETEMRPDGQWTRQWQAKGYRLRPEVPPAEAYRLVKEEVTCRQVCKVTGAGDARARECEPPDEAIATPAQIEANCERIQRRFDYEARGKGSTVPPGGWTLSTRLGSEERHGGNAVHLGRYDFGAFTLFAYEESFTSPVTTADFMTDARRVADQASAFLLERLRRELGADYDLTQLERYLLDLRLELGELVGMAAFTGLDLQLVEDESKRRAEARGLNLQAATNDAGQRALFALWFDRKVAPLIVPLRSGTPPLTFADLFSESMLLYLEQTYSAEVDALAKQLTEEHEGWLTFLHDFFLHTYAFNVGCRLPGRLVQTNGLVDQDGTVRWKLGLEDFPLQPKTLTYLAVSVDERRLRKFAGADLEGAALSELAAAARPVSEAALGVVRQAVLRDDRAAVEKAACAASAKLTAALAEVLGAALSCAETEEKELADLLESFPRQEEARDAADDSVLR